MSALDSRMTLLILSRAYLNVSTFSSFPGKPGHLGRWGGIQYIAQKALFVGSADFSMADSRDLYRWSRGVVNGLEERKKGVGGRGGRAGAPFLRHPWRRVHVRTIVPGF